MRSRGDAAGIARSVNGEGAGPVGHGTYGTNYVHVCTTGSLVVSSTGSGGAEPALFGVVDLSAAVADWFLVALVAAVGGE